MTAAVPFCQPARFQLVCIVLLLGSAVALTCCPQARAAEPAKPTIAAPQAYCVIPQSDPSVPPQSCWIPFAAEGSDCECAGADRHRMSGKVRIVLPPPNKPLG